MLEHYQGGLFDPCCGSEGMFTQSERCVQEHQATETGLKHAEMIANELASV